MDRRLRPWNNNIFHIKAASWQHWILACLYKRSISWSPIFHLSLKFPGNNYSRLSMAMHTSSQSQLKGASSWSPCSQPFHPFFRSLTTWYFAWLRGQRSSRRKMNFYFNIINQFHDYIWTNIFILDSKIVTKLINLNVWFRFITCFRPSNGTWDKPNTYAGLLQQYQDNSCHPILLRDNFLGNLLLPWDNHCTP